MANYFDQFDSGAETSDNFFDQFDEKKKKKRSKSDAMFYAAGLGFQDTLRGGQQIAGFNEEELAAEQQELRDLEDEYGGAVTAAYYGGLIADPVGWMLPVSRLKYLKHGATLAQKVKNLVKHKLV